ncbi:hypothetical protein BHM03_00027655 [Ensete ventricosum]|nr:hypothetical protein BHM03_00027655 [Ensete ventricosum]
MTLYRRVMTRNKGNLIRQAIEIDDQEEENPSWTAVVTNGGRPFTSGLWLEVQDRARCGAVHRHRPLLSVAFSSADTTAFDPQKCRGPFDLVDASCDSLP